ncbi:MAG: Mut7-C RNAse domain-containing protein [Candidatus Thorarchaeota archaeon]
MKFLVDAMLGKLTRFLRIFGYDTLYASDLIDLYNTNPVPDKKLTEYAVWSNRIIITKDLPFYNETKENAILLEGEGVYNYLDQLKRKLNLNYEFKIENARCSICNTILIKVNDKNSIREFVKRETFKTYNEFFQCNNPKCQKVFWNGPHIANIIKKLRKEKNY